MINDRQFYITKEKTSAFEDWKAIAFSNGYSLHYHKGLNVVYQCGDIVLLGYAWQVDSSRKSPQEELSELSQKAVITHNDVYDVEKSWCGRYVLIVNEFIYLDTCGLLGVVFSDKTVTSSLNVLSTIEDRKIIYPEIVHGKMPDFVPGMRTPYNGVYRLLPSQILNYVSKERYTRPLLIDEAPNNISEKERIDVFARYFTTSIKNFAVLFSDKPLWLALTGGRDSRASLACFEKAGVNYKTFTLWHKWISEPDYVIPQKLAQATKKPHRYIKRDYKKYSQQRFDDYKIHSAQMAVDEDWSFYAYNQYQSLIENDKPIVIVRSSIWEIPNYYYTLCYGKRSEDLTCIFPGINDNALFFESCMEWKKYVENDEINTSISFDNRALWEMRECCWLSSIEQSFDMMDGIISIQIANCRLFLSHLFGFDPKDRIQKTHEDKIASYLCPAFSKIPYDYEYDSINLKIHRLEGRLKRVIKNILGYNK